MRRLALMAHASGIAFERGASMIKLMIIGRRAPGITRNAAHRHLRDVHGQMVVRPPADAGAMPRGYVQNHVLDGVYPGGTGAHAIERDLMTELWFDDIGQLRASTATPYYLTNLKPDEPLFVDDDSVAKMVVRPDMLRESNSDARYKLFVLLGASDTGPVDAIRAVLDAKFLGIKGLDAAVVNIAQTPPDGTAPFVDMIYEGWFVERADADTALSTLTDMPGETPVGSLDPTRCFALVAEEYTTERLLGLTEGETKL